MIFGRFMKFKKSKTLNDNGKWLLDHMMLLTNLHDNATISIRNSALAQTNTLGATQSKRKIEAQQTLCTAATSTFHELDDGCPSPQQRPPSRAWPKDSHSTKQEQGTQVADPGAQAWHPAMVVAPHRNMLSSGKGKWYEAVPRRAMLDRLHSVCKRAPSRGVLAGVQSARRRPALQRAIADDFWSDRMPSVFPC